MTEIAVRDDEPRRIAPSYDPTGGRLIAWAESMKAAYTIGSSLCGTSFAPKEYRGKPEEAAAAILYGDEIGFTPTQALQNIYVISGKPSMYARAMVAIVQSKGHEVWTEESSPQKVTVCGRRRGSANIERSEWTFAKAKQAGYTNNAKYTAAPEDMLYARAASTVCRRIAADALAGIAYSTEELELSQEPTTTTLSRVAVGPQRVQRAKAVEAAREPELDPELDPTVEPGFGAS